MAMSIRYGLDYLTINSMVASSLSSSGADLEDYFQIFRVN